MSVTDGATNVAVNAAAQKSPNNLPPRNCRPWRPYCSLEKLSISCCAMKPVDRFSPSRCSTSIDHYGDPGRIPSRPSDTSYLPFLATKCGAEVRGYPAVCSLGRAPGSRRHPRLAGDLIHAMSNAGQLASDKTCAFALQAVFALHSSCNYPSSNTMAVSWKLASNSVRPSPALLRPSRAIPTGIRLQQRTKATAPFRLPDPRNEPNVSNLLSGVESQHILMRIES